MSAPSLHFCVFSFNRGRFLRNCIASLHACVKDPRVLIVDDDSDDPETLEILEQLGQRDTVISPQHADAADNKCGGLYANMQLALDRMPAGARICFVQDDTQLVRPLDTRDLEAIEHYFASQPEAAFLHHAFLRAQRRRRDQQHSHFDAASGSYFRDDRGQTVGLYFSAITIGDVDRLRALNWQFAPTERENEAHARELLPRMGFMQHPFLALLPNVPAWRGKRKTLALRLAEKLRRCGLHPYALMDEARNQAFRQRDPAQLPIAEDWLQLANDNTLPKPWLSHPLQGSSLLRLLNSLELKLRDLGRS